MNDKISRLPHWTSAVQILLASLWRELHGLSLYDWVLLMSLIISPLAFAFSVVFQWRQTRAIEKAAREGRVVTKPGIFKR